MAEIVLPVDRPGRGAVGWVAFHIAFHGGRLCWDEMRSECVAWEPRMEQGTNTEKTRSVLAAR
jgi:hypothetical protein